MQKALARLFEVPIVLRNLFWPAALAVLVFVLGPAAPCRAGFAVGLGQAGNYAVLGLDTTTLGTHINASNVTINGNVGVSHNSTLQVMAPSTVNGNVYFQDSGSVTGAGTITGSTIQQSLAQAVTDAFYANAQNSLLTPNQTISGDVTTSQTFNAVAGGLTVVDINGDINLNNNNITLSGTSSDVFVINVSGDLSLTGTASLLLSGGVTADHVLYNFTGGTATSQGSFNTHVGDVVNGTMLAPFYDMNLDGTWNGELIGGPLNIGLLSNATVNQNSFNPPNPVPAPSSAVLALAGLSLLGVPALRRFRRQPAVALA